MPPTIATLTREVTKLRQQVQQRQLQQQTPAPSSRAAAILATLTAMQSCSDTSQRVELLRDLLRLTVTTNPYIPITPTRKQLEFLLSDEPEILFGGAAGPGKSTGLLTAALQYVDVPGYAALLLRRRFSDLALPGALMARSLEWLSGTDARWNAQDHRWTFPSGATLSFGYLETENDKFRYQSSEVAFCGFDELTQFHAGQYLYLFSRLRRLAGSPIPMRMRAATNPGGVGHQWVKERFLQGDTTDRRFIPAKLIDNPHLDAEEYTISLHRLDPVTRQRLLKGDWDATDAGMFRREWFPIIDTVPAGLRKVRCWDLAGTEAKPGTDPDWTAGVLLGRQGTGKFIVLDVRRTRSTPANVEALVKQTAELDGRDTVIVIEQEPGSAAIALMNHYATALAGWTFRPVRHTGDKATRAAPFASQAESGNVQMLRGNWNAVFLDELELFPGGTHDDQVDAASECIQQLTMPTVTARPIVLGGGAAIPTSFGGVLCPR